MERKERIKKYQKYINEVNSLLITNNLVDYITNKYNCGNISYYTTCNLAYDGAIIEDDLVIQGVRVYFEIDLKQGLIIINDRIVSENSVKNIHYCDNLDIDTWGKLDDMAKSLFNTNKIGEID